MAQMFHRVALLMTRPSCRVSTRAMRPNPFLITAFHSSTYAQAVTPSAERRQFFVDVGVAPTLSHLDAITPGELEQRIERIKRLASEARLCIQDCGESSSKDDFNEELQTAKVAVDAAGMAYSDLLEELALHPEGVEVLNEVRKLYAPLVESVKQEFYKIGEANIIHKK